jgi:hypothetical protein
MVEMEEGAGASISPKVASALVAGSDPDRQRNNEGQRGERVGAGLGQFDRPRPEPAGLAEPGGLARPAGLLGQKARWARLALAN